mgnify:FL=1
MPELGIETYTSYEAFATDWDGSAKETRMTWQLLDQIDDDKILIELPQWLADENVGYTRGAVPTAFVGRIEAESEQAIHFADSAAAKSLRKLAHRITQLEQSDNADQDDWVDDRLADHQEQFNNQDDAVSLNEEWLPKAEILHAIKRDR